MLQYTFYLFVALFVLIYILRAILLSGFEHYRYRKFPKTMPFLKTISSKILLMQPILQKKLPSKVIDHKVYERFKINAQRYYMLLWILLFIILFLGTKIYLGAF